MVEIDSADVSQMVHSNSERLLAELNRKRAILRLGPLVAAVSAVLLAIVWARLHPYPAALVGVGLATTTWLAYRRDKAAKTTVLLYDFEPEVERTYGRLLLVAMDLAASARCWHVSASGAVQDKKYHAGASSLVNREPTSVRIATPEFLQTNVQTVRIDAGRQSLYLFPDRVLVFDKGRVGAIGYDELRLDAAPRRFIEDGPVPSDAQVVDHTWRYVNKQGGPDRRFASNREIPVCLYEEFHFFSPSGLNEIIQSSRTGNGEAMMTALQDLARLTHEVPERAPERISPEPHPSSHHSPLAIAAIATACFIAITWRWQSPSTHEVQRKRSQISPPAVAELHTANEAPTNSMNAATTLASIQSMPEEKDHLTSATEHLETTPASAQESTLSPTSLSPLTFATVEDAQKEAVRRYPALGVQGSAFNAAFIARYKVYRESNSAYFADNAWPVRLAEEISTTGVAGH